MSEYDATMAGLMGLSFFTFAVGFLLGGWFSRGNESHQNKVDRLERELRDQNDEHEQYRLQVEQHFERVSGSFQALTNQYSAIYAGLADGARELCRKEIRVLEDTGPIAPLEGPRDSSGSASSDDAPVTVLTLSRDGE